VNFRKPVITCFLVCLSTSMALGAVSTAAQGQRPKEIVAEPDNAGNRSLPLAQLTALNSEKRGGEARTLLARVKPTAANRNLLHLWRGLTYAHELEPEEAAVEFDQCTDFTETSLDGQFQAAFTYMGLDQCSKAIKILSTMLDKYPDCPGHAMQRQCYEARGDCYVGVGRFKEAIIDYRQAARLWPQKSQALLARAAELLRREHKCSEALALLNEAIATRGQPPEFGYLMCRASCLEELGKWPEATKDLTTVIRLALEGINHGGQGEFIIISRAYIERAKCYDHVGQPGLAAADRLAHQKMSREAESTIVGK
jgi:tetratricopeptide (TPR) repeat protein